MTPPSDEYDPAVEGAPGEPRDVIVATDGSEAADAAVSAGTALARTLGARAVLVYVRPSLGTLGAPYYQEKLSEQMAHARSALQRARRLADSQGVEPDEEILEGEAAERIVGLADARDALMIVIGSRGLGVVAGALLGSVSSAVLHRAGHRLRLHHHSTPSPVRRIIGGVMPVMRIVADVVKAHVDQSPLAGALKNAGFYVRGKNFRQEGKHLKLHEGIVPLMILIRKRFKSFCWLKFLKPKQAEDTAFDNLSKR